MTKKMIEDAACQKRRSNRKIAKEIQRKRGHTISYITVLNLRKGMDHKPFRVINKPLLSELNVQGRLNLCRVTSLWDADDCEMRLAVSDEFFIYLHGNTNSQNDIIWAVSRADIPEEIG